MRAERRDPTLWPKMLANPRGEEPVSEAKPYDIPKQLVWEAYQRVKANRGAAGVGWGVPGGIRTEPEG